MLDEKLAGAWALVEAPDDRLLDDAPSAIILQMDGRIRRLWRYRFRTGSGGGGTISISVPPGMDPGILWEMEEVEQIQALCEDRGEPLPREWEEKLSLFRTELYRQTYETYKQAWAAQCGGEGSTMDILGGGDDTLCDLYRVGGAGPGLAGYWGWNKSVDTPMEFWFGDESLLRCYGPSFVSASFGDPDDTLDTCEGEMICGCSETWTEGYGLDATGLRFVQGSFRRGGVAMDRERRTTDGEYDDQTIEVEVPATTPVSPPRPDHVWHYRAFPGVDAVEGDLLIADAADAPHFVATRDTELVIARHASDLSGARQYRYEIRDDALSLATEEGIETYRRIADPFTGDACPDILLAARWIG